MNDWQDSTRESYVAKGLASRSGYGKKPALLIIDFSYGFTDPDSPLGGDFTRVGGVNYGHVSRLHPDGYVDSSFNIGTGLDDIVWSMGVQLDRKPIPGGRYSLVDGNDVLSASRLNADGVYDNTFTIGEGVEGEVFAIVVQSDGGIVIGGDFKKVAGIAAKNIARLNPDGSFDANFMVGSGADKPVRDIAIQDDGKMVVVGEFGMLSGAAFSKVARLNLDGTPDSEFKPGAGADGIVQIHSTDMDELLQISESRVTRQLTAEEKERCRVPD